MKSQFYILRSKISFPNDYRLNLLHTVKNCIEPRSCYLKQQTLIIAKTYLIRKSSQYHQGLLKRFLCTGGFLNNSAIILEFIWPWKSNLNVEKVLIFQKQTQVHPKNAWGKHRSETKNFEIPPVVFIGGLYKFHVLLCSWL